MLYDPQRTSYEPTSHTYLQIYPYALGVPSERRSRHEFRASEISHARSPAMPHSGSRKQRYYCDYCDSFLTHESRSVRREHDSGYKHKSNVKAYYLMYSEEGQATLDAEARGLPPPVFMKPPAGGGPPAMMGGGPPPMGHRGPPPMGHHGPPPMGHHGPQPMGHHGPPQGRMPPGGGPPGPGAPAGYQGPPGGPPPRRY